MNQPCGPLPQPETLVFSTIPVHISHTLHRCKIVVNVCHSFQDIFRRSPTPCSSRLRPVLVCIPADCNRRTHGLLSDTCETRRSSHTSSTLVHAEQPVEEMETDPPHQRVPAEDRTNPSYSLLVLQDTLASALVET